MNLQYILKDDEIISTPLSSEQLTVLRQSARDKLVANPDEWAFRSCWNCNPAHSHFLNNITDGFLMRCFSCSRVFYNGADITEEAA